LNGDFRPMSYCPAFPAALGGCGARRVQRPHLDRRRVLHLGAQPSTKIRLPSVVAPRKYQPAARRVAFTWFNAFLRDRFTCQYRGETFASSALTFEHVILRPRGSQTSWSNIVTACMPCNTGKGNSMRIKPRRPPREPTPSELLAAKRTFPPDHLHESWMAISIGMWSWKPN